MLGVYFTKETAKQENTRRRILVVFAFARGRGQLDRTGYTQGVAPHLVGQILQPRD